MWHYILLLIIIIILCIDFLYFTKSEHFVSNNPIDISWYQDGNEKHYIYDSGQPNDSYEFDKDGNYNKEIGSEEYIKCRNDGFTKEFCLETPTASNDPDTCMCDNGAIGYYKRGFKGNCICNSSVPSGNYI